MACYIAAVRKYVDEVIDYSIDWTPRLPTTESIVGSVWSVKDSTLTIQDGGISGAATLVRISDGNAATAYELKNQITLSNGAVYEELASIGVMASSVH